MPLPIPLRRTLFVRQLTLVAGSVVLLALGFVFLGLQPLHERLAASEFDRVADSVGATLRHTLSLPAQVLAPAADWVARQSAPLDDGQIIEDHFRGLLSHVDNLSSVVLGATDGRGWMLLRRADGSWKSRLTDPARWGERHRVIEEAADGRRNETLIAMRYDPRTRPWYQGAITAATDAAHWTQPYTFFTTGDPGITVSQRLRLADGSMAVLGLDVMLRDLSVTTQAARVGRDGVALILTDDERILALPRRPATITEPEWFGSLMLPAVSLGMHHIDAALSAWRQGGRKELSARVVTAGGRDWLAAVHAYPVEAQTLWIVILAPAADFAPEWPWIALGTAAALATLLALASLIARREARRIATPLETLATLGKRIGTLDFSTPVSADTRIAEIRELGDALETMRATLARNQLAIDEQAERLKTQVEELRAAEQRIHALAYYDPLTGLPNRRLMLDRLAHALSASERRDSRGALLLLDLDNFKTLNDSLGHDHGDELLCEVGRRLAHNVRKCDTVARLGGDEFIVILEDLSRDLAAARRQADEIGHKILAALSAPCRFKLFAGSTSASIGAVMFGRGGDSAETLLKQADLAMYRSKARGRNCLHFFTADMAAGHGGPAAPQAPASTTND